MTPAEPPPPPIVGVSGGADGIDAHLDDMESTAGLIGGVGADMTLLALTGHRYLADPGVLASAVLDPAGSARFEWAMLRALDGDGGLTTVAVGIGVSAVKLKAAAVAYRTADSMQAAFMDAAEFVMAPVTFVVSVGGLLAISGKHVLEGDGVVQALQHTITDHPGIVDGAVGSVPGLLATLGAVNPLARGAWGAMGYPTTVPAGAAGLARLYPDGRPTVRPLGHDESQGAITPPATLKNVLEGLASRNGHEGEIDVRVVETTDARGNVHRSVIVDIPGTKVWNPPGHDTDMIQDLGTNLHGVANDTTSYERAVRIALDKALDDAGVKPGDHVPVMLVGHSQGGIVAAHAAGNLGSDRYDVTHVVTAGSPVGEVDIPERVRVLSIENTHDVIPHLDSQENPDRSNWTTVRVDEQRGSIKANHAIDASYVPAAAAIDDSRDPSIRAYLDSAAAFLDGTDVTTSRFAVGREP